MEPGAQMETMGEYSNNCNGLLENIHVEFSFWALLVDKLTYYKKLNLTGTPKYPRKPKKR